MLGQKRDGSRRSARFGAGLLPCEEFSVLSPPPIPLSSSPNKVATTRSMTPSPCPGFVSSCSKRNPVHQRRSQTHLHLCPDSTPEWRNIFIMLNQTLQLGTSFLLKDRVEMIWLLWKFLLQAISCSPITLWLQMLEGRILNALRMKLELYLLVAQLFVLRLHKILALFVTTLLL